MDGMKENYVLFDPKRQTKRDKEKETCLRILAITNSNQSEKKKLSMIEKAMKDKPREPLQGLKTNIAFMKEVFSLVIKEIRIIAAFIVFLCFYWPKRPGQVCKCHKPKKAKNK